MEFATNMDGCEVFANMEQCLPYQQGFLFLHSSTLFDDLCQFTFNVSPLASVLCDRMDSRESERSDDAQI